MKKIFDLHNDFYLKLKSDKQRNAYYTKTESFAEHIISAVWTSELDSAQSFEKIESARNFVNGKQNLFLGVEDLHFLSKDMLEKFLSFRPLYAGLTWNNTNCLAGGVYESGGVTSFGKKVVRAMEHTGIKVDLAHLNEESFMELGKILTQPCLCSHTACFGVNSHPRNLKDYQIKMIIDTGGLVGISLVSDFLNGTHSSNVNDVVKHIDYFACKFGIDHLAIGTDFYGTKHLPKGMESYQKLCEKLSTSLIKIGYTEKSINKIFYENANQFFSKLN